MTKEWTSGTMADFKDTYSNKSVSLNYMTNNYDYIIFNVIANAPGYTYWSQWETKEEATADYNEKWEKLFK